MRPRPLLAALLAIGVAWGCAPDPKQTAEGYPIFQNVDEAQQADERARDMSIAILAKLDQRQPLTEDDRARLRESLRLTEGLRRFEPGKFDTYFRLGQIYSALGDYRRAVERFRQYLELAPADEPQISVTLADARFLIAVGLLNQDQPAQAVVEVSQALAMYPGVPNYLMIRARALQRLGRSAEAKRDLARILAAEPGDQEALKLLREIRRGS